MGDAEDFEIKTGNCGLDLRGQITGREVDAAGNGGLIEQAGEKNRLDAQAMLLKNTVVTHHFQQIMSDADTAVADFDGLQCFVLSMKRRRNQEDEHVKKQRRIKSKHRNSSEIKSPVRFHAAGYASLSDGQQAIQFANVACFALRSKWEFVFAKHCTTHTSVIPTEYKGVAVPLVIIY